MKITSLFTVLLISALSFSQDSQNEIKRVAQLRDRYELMEQVRVFPNPSNSNHISIEVPTGSSCEIYSLSGQLIQSATVDNGLVRFSNLSQGTYIVKIKLDHMIRTEKFVVL
jgi:hypothetical protein